MNRMELKRIEIEIELNSITFKNSHPTSEKKTGSLVISICTNIYRKMIKATFDVQTQCLGSCTCCQDFSSIMPFLGKILVKYFAK